ncbi:MAG: hypothetical protein HYX94_12750 [Chloroflexi bacterium]|nr:hypothetical protein [Chloroflexota bacterium]
MMNYGYTHWHQMFNNRQLLSLAILAQRTQQINDHSLRSLFAILLSGCLEFNNMFCSYKGEGTGAVRHMFAHHILKPERTPLEANLWGTPRSSGAFSTLFENRILRAIDYKQHPFEIRVTKDGGKISGVKVHGLSDPLDARIEQTYEAFVSTGAHAYLSCGDSGKTELPGSCVDAVITDPPFFDNVHYSELADFFYVWQRQILRDSECHERDSTRSNDEVQSTSVDTFTKNLTRVLTECARVLKSDGVLAFTYHHSRTEGWAALLDAVAKAGFTLVASHPVKAEMAVGVPKTQAKEPIDLDIVLVGRKSESVRRAVDQSLELNELRCRAQEQVDRLNGAGRFLSKNDVRVVVMGQVLVCVSTRVPPAKGGQWFHDAEGEFEQIIEKLWRGQNVTGVQQPRLF